MNQLPFLLTNPKVPKQTTHDNSSRTVTRRRGWTNREQRVFEAATLAIDQEKLEIVSICLKPTIPVGKAFLVLPSFFLLLTLHVVN